ncbi:hypothetical protein ADUPG1_008044, partial [Aduncisulcus paluster]
MEIISTVDFARVCQFQIAGKLYSMHLTHSGIPELAVLDSLAINPVDSPIRIQYGHTINSSDYPDRDIMDQESKGSSQSHYEIFSGSNIPYHADTITPFVSMPLIQDLLETTAKKDKILAVHIKTLSRKHFQCSLSSGLPRLNLPSYISKNCDSSSSSYLFSRDLGFDSLNPSDHDVLDKDEKSKETTIHEWSELLIYLHSLIKSSYLCDILKAFSKLATKKEGPKKRVTQSKSKVASSHGTLGRSSRVNFIIIPEVKFLFSLDNKHGTHSIHTPSRSMYVPIITKSSSPFSTPQNVEIDDKKVAHSKELAKKPSKVTDSISPSSSLQSSGSTHSSSHSDHSSHSHTPPPSSFQPHLPQDGLASPLSDQPTPVKNSTATPSYSTHGTSSSLSSPSPRRVASSPPPLVIRLNTSIMTYGYGSNGLLDFCLGVYTCGCVREALTKWVPRVEAWIEQVQQMKDEEARLEAEHKLEQKSMSYVPSSLDNPIESIKKEAVSVDKAPSSKSKDESEDSQTKKKQIIE